MNVLAELACAQVPTSTISEAKINREKLSKIKSFSPSNDNDWTSLQSNDKADKDQPKKPLRNPIKELFERKNELNDRKHHHHHHHHHYHQQQQQEKFISLNFQSDSFGLKQHNKNKKIKRQDDEYHPLIRKSPFGFGMQERKKRRGDKKRNDVQNKVKDVYEFDDEDSQAESGFNSTLSLYRSRSEKAYEVNCIKTKEINVGDLVSKTITKSLDGDKPADSMDKRLESMIERKFKEMESSIPKTKGALKSFNLEEKQQQQQQSITGPMDSFVERKRSKRTGELTAKHKSKKRSKNSKKRSRNAWYEDDSSDEFVTAIKADGIGVGISKSQRTCSKGKQNLFAELSSSSDSEYEDKDELKNLFRDGRPFDGPIGETPDGKICPKADGEFNKSNEEADIDWINGAHSREESRHEFDNKKNVSESDMSDRPLIIDERKESEHDDVSVNGNDNYIYQANNDNDNDNDNAEDDDETDNRSEPAFELDDLYREDSSVIASDSEDSGNDDDKNAEIEKDNYDDDHNKEKDEFIPLDKALDLLDNTDTDNDESIPLEKALALLDSTDNVEKIFDGSAVGSRSRSKSKSKSKSRSASPQEKINYEEVESKLSIANDDCDDDNDDLADDLPEKLTTNEKPEEKPSDNLPLHVFLSRKVQESKKRKEEQLKKLKKQEEEEEERAALTINMEFQSTRRQRKCAIGKQGLLAEISSSDEEYYFKETGKRGANDKIDNGCDKSRRQKRESKEKKKERYIEKKHEQMIAKEQKAIEEEILRELELKRDANNKELDVAIDIDADVDANTVAVAAPVVNKDTGGKKNLSKDVISEGNSAKKKHRVSKKISGDFKCNKDKDKFSSDTENKCEKSTEVKKNKNNIGAGKKESQSRNSSNTNSNSNNSNGNSISNSNSNNTNSSGKKSAVRTNRKSTNKRNNKSTHENPRTNGSGTDDEELRTTKSWNKVEEGVGVAIGRRKRAAANQLYYWSSSSDDDEEFIQPSKTVEEEDDRQEQHGWIVGDSHKKMITMLAMEKKLKEKRRRSEDDCNGKSKNKKHRNSTS